MPPARASSGRASKACESCRRGKTRCYIGHSSSGACLRCNTLRLECSLQEDNSARAERRTLPTSVPSSSHDCAAVEQRADAEIWVRNDRVSELERTVQRVVRTIALPSIEPQESPARTIPIRVEQPISTSTREAPLLVIQDAASDVDGAEEASDVAAESIIDKGFLTPDDVIELLNLFRAHYSRWVALRESDEPVSHFYIMDSPLLLCACCLIAIRHWSVARARLTAPKLFHEAKSLLGYQLLHSPQPLSFFQAVLILSLWSTTVGQRPLSLDSWLTSGYAIQQASASNVFKPPSATPGASGDRSVVGPLLLWNRSCLAHLHACVSMKRASMVSKGEIDRLREQLPLNSLTNFEMRLLAELYLYWTLYETAVAARVNLPQAQAALQSWKKTWAGLFDQPRSQFLQMGFHFAQLLLYEQALNNKSAAVRESLLTEMVRLCSAILELAMNTTDDRTRHLTDHIYHMITFAAVTLCRLLNKYEMQLDSRLNLASTDMLVLDTVQWLRTLGTELHVGNTMSQVIDAAHRKLRPEIHLSIRSRNDIDHPTPDHNAFPDLLAVNMSTGMDTSWNFDWDAMIPDWQSYTSDELGHGVNVSR